MADEATRALAAAAEAAGRAPSIHNTQPWRWVVDGTVLDLYAERGRYLPELDPEGRLLMLSCGAALHHARVALLAEGWRHEVERPADEPLARLRVLGRQDTEPAAMRRFQSTLIRHTDRRPVSDTPVDPAALAAVTAAVRAEGPQVHVLRPEQVLELAAAVDLAARAESTDERQLAELAPWVGGTRADGTGVPDAAIPAASPQTTVAGRDFGAAGTLPTGSGHDASAVYAVLYGSGDVAADWLRAGEALSAGWLDAIGHGLSLLPVSAPVEIASTRHMLRGMLAGIGFPYLVFRLGVADPHHAGARPTPRLRADQVVEVRGG